MTNADDKANGTFICELIASNSDVWVRAIQVEVVGKFKSVAGLKKFLLRYNCNVV